jgi:hypothetical protein
MSILSSGSKGKYSDDSGFLCDSFTWPTEIATVQSQCAVFLVSSSYADFVDTFGADTGVGGLATEFKLSLFAVRGALSTGCCTLMTGVTRDTHPATVSFRSSYEECQ